MNLGLVTLYVHNLQKATQFYTEVLHLEIDETQSGPVFTMLRTGNGAFIALEDVKILPPNQAKAPGSFELAFEVENVDALFEQWTARGIEIVTPPEDAPFGRSFLAKDPEGHYLSMYKLAVRP